jgi:dTDP-4-amino-4,6-dideoxygalactose transaminase
MRIAFVDLKAQYHAIRTEIDSAIQGVINDTSFVGGPIVKRFEDAFAAWLGASQCVGCANGTDAIELLLRAWGIGSGDEVIVPALTWISTSEAVSNVGARPVFADTLPGTYTIDPASVRQRISPRTRAIVPVHLYGLPADMDSIGRIAKEHGLRVLEDSAQAHGAEYRGKLVGTLADGATFSFYPGKNLGAYGDAGCVVTGDADVARRVRLLSNHGQLKKHEHEIEGRNSRLDTIQAAILGAKLPHLERWNEARRRHAARYDARLRELGVPTGARPDGSTHVFHLYVVEVPQRERVVTYLREHGVETAIHYPRALPELPAYTAQGYDPKSCPVASASASRVLSLPMYAELTDGAIDLVCARLQEALRAVT